MNDLSPRLDTLDRNDLLKEAMELAREQGVTNQADWNELVEELVESHLQIGELSPDQDLEGTKTILRDAWDEYQRQAAEESTTAIEEDPDAPKG